MSPAIRLTTFPPLPGHPHTHTLIFLHGRGGTVPSFLSSLSAWESSSPKKTIRTALPTGKLVFPQAPSRPLSSSPDEVMNQWFDVFTPQDFSLNENLQLPGLRESVSFLLGLIASEAAVLGGDYSKIILAGISMGGAVSVHTLLHLPKPLGAFLGFCCRLPFQTRASTLGEMREVLALDPVGADHKKGGADEEGENDEVLRRTPIMLQHCADDPLVRIENGRAMRDSLIRFGAERVEWREYQRGGHRFKSPEGMDDLVEFIRRVVFAEENKDSTEGSSRDNNVTDDGVSGDAMDLSSSEGETEVVE